MSKDLTMVVQRIADITPYKKNARKNDAAVDAVVESIKQCGYIAPIIIDEDGVILAGHTRYKALLKLGREEAECIVKAGLTEDQKKKYRLLDNKTNELAEWDFDMLAEELEGLDFGTLDLNWGVEKKEAKVVEDDYDKPAPVVPKSKLGDVWLLGRHRLMCGDSTNLADVTKLVDGHQVDMLLTDPPYNVNYEGTAGKIKNDSMEDSAFREFLFAAFSNAKEVMKPGAAFHIWHADSEGYNFRGACLDAGLKIRQCLIWVKNALVLGRQDFQWKHEPCLYGENPVDLNFGEEDEEEHQPALYGWKDGTHYWFKNRKQTTVLQFDKPKKSAEHPTMKPVLLFDYEMKCNTKPGEIVLDLFAGSGTTVIAAEQNGRTAYVMEFDPKFADVIVDRWETFTGEKAVLVGE